MGEVFFLLIVFFLGIIESALIVPIRGDSGGDGRNIYAVKFDDAILPDYVICLHKNPAL